jgi:hypothetical protein
MVFARLALVTGESAVDFKARKGNGFPFGAGCDCSLLELFDKKSSQTSFATVAGVDGKDFHGCFEFYIVESFLSPIDGGDDPFVQGFVQQAVAEAEMDDDFVVAGEAFALRGGE